MIGIDREQLARDLARQVVKVTFRKRDGELREMKCTLNADRIAAADRIPKGATDVVKAAIAEQSIMRVLDVELGEWRAFTLANVEALEVVEKIV